MEIWFLQIQFSSSNKNWFWVCRFDFSDLLNVDLIFSNLSFAPQKQYSSSEWKMDFLNPFAILRCPLQTFLSQQKVNFLCKFLTCCQALLNAFYSSKFRLSDFRLIFLLILTNFCKLIFDLNSLDKSFALILELNPFDHQGHSWPNSFRSILSHWMTLKVTPIFDCWQLKSASPLWPSQWQFH